jgi:hypothetical protein
MSLEYYPKIARIIERLLARTLRGEIKWERTAAEGVFQSSFPDYSVVVTGRTGGPGVLDEYSFEIRNSEGEVVEKVSRIQLHWQLPEAAEVLADLYDAARRRALSADEALDKVLQYLEA